MSKHERGISRESRLGKSQSEPVLPGSRSKAGMPSFDVWQDFDFFKAWKQEPAVRRVLQDKLAAKLRREKAHEQAREEARLMRQGWHRLSSELHRRGLPNLGSQGDLARRLLVALQAEQAEMDNELKKADGAGRRPSKDRAVRLSQ